VEVTPMTSPSPGSLGTDPYVPFPVRVRAVHPLGDSFVRVTVTGPDLDLFADNGDDQRIKLVFPLPGRPLPAFPPGADWYAAWRALPPAERNPMRTYTVRAVRPAARELDVDLVRHGDAGPASRWAGGAAEGDELLVVGPNAAHPGPTRAAAWNPPPGRPFLLLGGDETAVPAVAAILERLPADARGTAVLEVPAPGDVLDLAAPAGITVCWHARGSRPHGEALTAAVREVAGQLPTGAAPAGLADTDGILWDVPDQPAPGGAGCYAWLAGEATCIAALRRHLVLDRGLDRRAVAFMGYWKAGVAEPN
jgi:NADPH-dependent ferric siderophore reductase